MTAVTIAIPTYARVSRLEEALWCALQQTVPCSVVVLSDCEAQTLTSADPRITVYNRPLFHHLGAKRNALLDLVQTEWTCWLDDDDWLFPWYVEDLLGEASRAEANMVQPDKLWLVHGGHDGDRNLRWEPNSTAVMPSLVKTTDAREKFPSDIDTGEDQAFRAKMTCHRFTPIDGGYAYRWANGTHHVSGSGRPDSGVGVRHEAAIRMRMGVEPCGTIPLIPRIDLSWFHSAPEHILKRAGWL